MQTVVFTLIPWILDRVEDDKRGGGVIIPLLLSFLRTRESSVVGDNIMVIARKPPGMAEAIWRRDSIVIPASARESRVDSNPVMSHQGKSFLRTRESSGWGGESKLRCHSRLRAGIQRQRNSD